MSECLAPIRTTCTLISSGMAPGRLGRTDAQIKNYKKIKCATRKTSTVGIQFPLLTLVFCGGKMRMTRQGSRVAMVSSPLFCCKGIDAALHTEKRQPHEAQTEPYNVFHSLKGCGS